MIPATLELLKAPAPRLREVSAPVELEDGIPGNAVVNLAADMLRVMHDNFTVGLAAIQLGVRQRLIVVAPPHLPEMIMINPVILWRDALQWSSEGCLSAPGKKVVIRRAKRIKVRYLDLDGTEHTQKLSNYSAAIVQHEIDHLDGILFTDHIKPDMRS